jgi:tetratricopeptide (TPR) repeat protein
MYQPSAITVNIRAAIAIEEKKFDEGREHCLKALQLDPKFFPALFNLAEIPFMQGKYAEARLAYEKLLDDEASADLVKFRLYLTYLLEKDDERAKAHLDRIPLLNDTPIYYFAFAAWEFAHGDEKKAQSYINSAETVFPKTKLSNFADVFYDIGWLKRPTGNEP